MAIDPQLLSFMPHTVTIQPYASVNNYGEDQQNAGSQRTAKAYVEPSKVMADGMQTREDHQPIRAYIADTSITLRDRIILPDGTAPEIASVDKHVEVLGLEHTVVSFR